MKSRMHSDADGNILFVYTNGRIEVKLVGKSPELIAMYKDHIYQFELVQLPADHRILVNWVSLRIAVDTEVIRLLVSGSVYECDYSYFLRECQEPDNMLYGSVASLTLEHWTVVRLADPALADPALQVVYSHALQSLVYIIEDEITATRSEAMNRRIPVITPAESVHILALYSRYSETYGDAARLHVMNTIKHRFWIKKIFQYSYGVAPDSWSYM